MRLSALAGIGLLLAACGDTGGNPGLTEPDAGGSDASSDAPPADAPDESTPADAGEAGADAAACDRHFPACTSPPPSYMTDVAPIIHSVCVLCHYPGSNMTRTSYTTYQGVSGDRGSILGQIYSCNMPPATAPVPLTATQRETLLVWLDCGSPNN